MSTAVRQRNVKPVGNGTAGSSHLDVSMGNATTKKSDASSHKQQLLLASLISRKNAVYYIPLLVFCYIFGPTAMHAPKAIYVWASHGFVTEFLLGAGIRDMVGSLVVDPNQLMVGDVNPPTPLAAYKDIVLEEYEQYRKSHDIPIIANLDPDEQGPLDTKGVWKTLFLKTMGRYTCAASHFPKTLEAVRNSGFTAYSIMFSRLAPGQKIEPHTGFSKIIQIYHLALKVPKAETPDKRPYITVKGCDDIEETINCKSETYHWTEGKEFIFDDSFTHYAENPTNEERLVLFLHIKRIDFKGWREEFVASVFCYIFSWVPFDGVLRLVRGTEATCAATAAH